MERKTYQELKLRASELQHEIEAVKLELRMLHTLADIRRSGDDYEVDTAFLSDPEPLKRLIAEGYIKCTRIQGAHEWYELTESGNQRLDDAMR